MNKKFKSIISITIILIFVLSLSVGCNKAKEDKQISKNDKETSTNSEKKVKKQTLEVAAFEGGYGREYWEAVIEKFEKDNPGVEVKLTLSPKINDIIRPKLVAGNPPDFIYPKGELAQMMLKDDALLPLDDIFDSKATDKEGKLRDKIIDGFLDYCSPLDDGKIYMAPTNMDVKGMFYNKTLFNEKGWKVPETWNEFFAYAEKAKEMNSSLFTYQGIYPAYNEMVICPAIASAGGRENINAIINYEEGAWKTDAVRKTFEVYDKIAKNDWLLKGTIAMNHTQAQTAFLQGKALFCPNGSWFENEMKDAIPEEGFSFGFMPIPAFEKGQQRYVQTGYERNIIPRKAKNIELAKKFIKYQYTDENIKLKAEKTGAIMPVKGAVELCKEFISDTTYNCFNVFDNEGAKPLVVNYKITPNTEIVINDEVYNPINSIMNGDITVDEWINRVDKASGILRKSLEK